MQRLIGGGVSLALVFLAAYAFYLFGATPVIPSEYVTIQRTTSEVYNTTGNSGYLLGLFALGILSVLGSVACAVFMLEHKAS